MSEEGLISFDIPLAVPNGTPNVDIKCTGEIVSNMFEAKHTKTEAERSAIDLISYGDLPEHERKARSLQESCWTVNKQYISQQYGPPLLKEPDDAKHFMILGTNGMACYALEEMDHTDSVIETHKKYLVDVECAAVYHSLRHQLRGLRTHAQAKEMLTEVMRYTKLDHGLRPAVTRISKDLTRKLKKLPETPKGADDGSEVKVAKRPGDEPPQIQCMLYVFSEETPAGEPPIGETPKYFRLWSINVEKKEKEWKPCKMDPIQPYASTVPNVAFNKTHMVIVYQHIDGIAMAVDLYELTGLGRPKRKRCDRFTFVFPEEHFDSDTGGLIHISLSDFNIVCISYSSGVVVFDALRTYPVPRVIVLRSPHKRYVTCAKVHHPTGALRPNTPPSESVPEWCGTLIMGTSMGECFGMCWVSGELQFTELIPATESVFSILYSNRRIIAQSALALSGRMTPFLTDQLTHLPTSRFFGFDVCGVIIFVLEKYGSVQLFSTSTRSILFPFKAPKDMDFGLGMLTQPAYNAVHAEPESVVVLYPNGVTRVFTLRAKARQIIDDALKGKKKKK